jgi:hypothetical protein
MTLSKGRKVNKANRLLKDKMKKIIGAPFAMKRITAPLLPTAIIYSAINALLSQF